MSFFASTTSISSSLLNLTLSSISLTALCLLAGGCGDDDGDGMGIDTVCPPDTDNNNDDCRECHTSPNDNPSSAFHKWCVPETEGAHNKHRQTKKMEPISCQRCHTIPESSRVPEVTDTSNPHMNGQGDVFITGNEPKNIHGFSCSDCHPQQMNWWAKYDLDCLNCHRPTEPAHNITDLAWCYLCHDETMRPNGNFNQIALHGNRGTDVKPWEKMCATCHFFRPNSHLDNEGIEDSVIITMITGCYNCHFEPVSPFDYPHRLHFEPNFSEEINFLPEEQLCQSCHNTPSTASSHSPHQNYDCERCHHPQPSATENLIGHMTREHSKNSCPQCHALSGAARPNPLWGGASMACGDCHGIPPPHPHPQTGSNPTSCSVCHTQFNVGDHLAQVRGDGSVNLGP